MERRATIARECKLRVQVTDIPIRRVCCISNHSNPASIPDIDFLNSLEVAVDLPRNNVELLEMFRKYDPNIVHICIDGNIELWRGQPRIHLPNGSSIIPADLEEKRIQEQLKRTRPLVFLNVSRTSQPDLTLVRIEKWGRKFAQAGASLFAGFAWKFEGERASEFVIDIYRNALDGLTIGRAIKNAQGKLAKFHKENWSAYYRSGDPNCRIKLGRQA